MEHHISQIRKVCYLELKRMSNIRKYLTTDVAKKLACSFILSRIDYCNSLLAGLPQNRFNKLQQIQNCAARIIMRIPKKQNITPILKQLHWLPVHTRIDYKIAIITHKCIHEPDFPIYLKNSISRYCPSRNLRSSNSCTLVKPKMRLKTYGDRSFQYQAALIWNSLPEDLRQVESFTQFKSMLKTHYFCKSLY